MEENALVPGNNKGWFSPINYISKKNQPLFDKNQFPNNLLKMDNGEHRSDSNAKDETNEECFFQAH